MSSGCSYFHVVGWLWCAAVAPVMAASDGAMLPESLDLDAIRGVVVQHDGRWPPLDTVARDTVESVTGEAFYQGRDPVLWLLAWTFDATTWMEQPLITIGNAELRELLHLPASQRVFSYAELAGHQHLRTLVEGLSMRDGKRKMNPLESKVGDISERLVTLQDVFQGQAIRVIPDPDRATAAWRCPGSTMGSDHHAGPDHAADDAAVDQAWRSLGEAFRAGEAKGFTTASERFIAAVSALPAQHRPAPQLTATELRYNRLGLFRRAWIAMAIGALLSLAGLVVRRRWFDVVAAAGLVVGFGLLTWGLSLRWQIAGRIPAANMFESLLFLSWGMGAFAIVAMLVQRQRMIPLTASVMGALSLFLADMLPIDHFIRPIAPVLLDTVWMSIHVPVIMVSYSVLALAVLIAHVLLIVMAAAPHRTRLADAMDSWHYWYIHVGSLLLIAGIITGSMWAASSWGRYWGWDPKEVWSLVAFLGYLTILHVRIDRERVPRWAYAVGALLAVGLFIPVAVALAPLSVVKVISLVGAWVGMAIFVLARGRFAMTVKSILAFWMIIMTYVGVNYVLGTGLHSYGFGTGAVVRYMFLVGAVDLALVGVCCVIYLVRQPRLLPVNG